MRDGKARPKVDFHLIFKNGLCQILVVDPCKKSLIWKLELRAIRIKRKPSGHALGSSTDFRKKGSNGRRNYLCVAFYNFINIILIHCAGGTVTQFLDEMRSIIFSRVVLNMFKGHHLQLRCNPLLFDNFKCFNIKASTVHHPVTQKEVDELLA